MKHYSTFKDAYRAWRDSGGAMNYWTPISATERQVYVGPEWQVGTVLEIEAATGNTARYCTEAALSEGGMTARGIAHAMEGWVG